MPEPVIAGNNNSGTFISPELLNRRTGRESSSSSQEKEAKKNNLPEKRNLGTSIRERSRTRNAQVSYSKPFPSTLFIFCIILDIVDFIASFTIAISIVINIIVAVIIAGALKARSKSLQKDLEEITGTKNKGKSPSVQRNSKATVEKNLKKFSEKVASKSFKRFLLGNMIPIVQFFTLWSFFLVSYHKKEKEFISEALRSVNEGN